jgi:hypothetical protein
MKAEAWDAIGSLFWELGRSSARPSEREIDEFLADLPPGSPCAVIGASTKELIEAMIEAGHEVTVLDFSRRMCADLGSALGPGQCRIQKLDITRPVPEDLRATQAAVLSDRLLNRFGPAEAVDALAGMAALSAPGGEVRATVKLGFYPMDLRMISLGRERGCLERFYDPEERTLDFGAADGVLESAVLPHGEIPRDLLLRWYRGRGLEKRFDDAEIRALAEGLGDSLRLEEAAAVPDSSETTMYRWRAAADPRRAAGCAG